MKRNRLEQWFDRHNHTMAFVRTMFAMMAGLTSAAVFLRVFGIL